MRVGLIQQANVAERGVNVGKLEERIAWCAGEGAEVVVLQELHNEVYFCQREDTAHFNLAEGIPGPSTETFGALAKRLGVVIVLSLFEKRAAGVYHNTAVVMERDGTIAGKYRKMHIPDDPGYCEKFYFTPGDMGFEPIGTSSGKLGVLLCWDQWYPEAARLMALRGAEILIYPTAIGWSEGEGTEEQRRQLDAWRIIQRAHAVANGLPVVTVNRVGREGGIAFWGRSFAVGPQGEGLVELSSDRDDARVVEIDKRRSEYVRRWWPFFRDRRIDAYGRLTERFSD